MPRDAQAAFDNGRIFGAVANDDELIDVLATLTPFAYDNCRKSAARQLGVRIATLDSLVDSRRATNGKDAETCGGLFADPEPWPEPIEGDTLLDALAGLFRRYVVLPKEAADAMALWVLHAHCFDAAQISPILAMLSRRSVAEKRPA